MPIYCLNYIIREPCLSNEGIYDICLIKDKTYFCLYLNLGYYNNFLKTMVLNGYSKKLPTTLIDYNVNNHRHCFVFEV